MAESYILENTFECEDDMSDFKLHVIDILVDSF
uniref:Uncharacterized protein n=1 Tax=Arundo donax TaxID=35708 RepID=A0A0A8ZYC7_ARUDO